ncbi:HNH endonuclease [Vibrio phage Thalassa]|uniref:HNH nuclease domain-containing protein n=1 Tax=Vibrio phage Thalassa TaxID=2570301 RepID=A0A2H5BH19_9CAUD|nr:HNH endonuclease [Vibrio phage Thalassa]AUG85286.1 hypothetical protein THALASSA_84 [Vibrio phage Thalassa]
MTYGVEDFKPFYNYKIYPDGRVWSLAKKRFLSPFKNNSGYLMVNLCLKGKSTKKLVHRLVAELFVEGKQPGLEVDHRDRDKLNNWYENLRWQTHSENASNKGVIKVKSYPSVRDPNGVVHEVEPNMKYFCINHGLDRSAMSKVTRGIWKQYKGWRLANDL